VFLKSILNPVNINTGMGIIKEEFSSKIRKKDI